MEMPPSGKCVAKDDKDFKDFKDNKDSKNRSTRPSLSSLLSLKSLKSLSSLSSLSLFSPSIYNARDPESTNKNLISARPLLHTYALV